jgi:hypothetical protein
MSLSKSSRKAVWDFKFSRRRVWCSELSSGIYCRVKWLSTDVSEVRTASIIHIRTYDLQATEISVKGKRSFSPFLLFSHPAPNLLLVWYIGKGFLEFEFDILANTYSNRPSLAVWVKRGLTHHPSPLPPLWTIPTHVTSRARGPPDGRHDVTIPPATIGLNHWHIHVIGSSFVFCINRWLTACEPNRNSYRPGVSIQSRGAWCWLATVPHFRTQVTNWTRKLARFVSESLRLSHF